jgi:hypothetical protein
MTARKDALKLIAADVGVPVAQLLERATYDSAVPGICGECRAVVDDLEPDAEGYECLECGAEDVNSCLVLAGLV